jgi:ribonucleoside-diphosphate reductase alpha chain
MTSEKSNYFKGNSLAESVWASKYALKKNGEQIETSPDQMHTRLASEFARIEQNYPSPTSIEHIFSMFQHFSKVIPQGSVMSQLGNPNQIGSLSNCIVLPKIHDSYGGIMYTDQQLAQVMKRRCGAGIDISTLRPSGCNVSNAAQTSTGAVSFMHRFSNTTREVAQDGRRGALMISMDIRHPEATEFAQIKQDLSKVTGANISLKLTDAFMRAVETNNDFLHTFPIEKYSEEGDDFSDIPYDKLVMWTNALVKRTKAEDVWNTIIKCAHTTAEPGLIFWDRQHYYSPSSLYKEFENISTNPCSEIAMGNDSCRLIAKNMFAHVIFPFTHNAYFDFEDWYWTCYFTMKFMDDLVDLELEHISRILSKIESDEEPDEIKRVEYKTWLDLYQIGERGRRTGAGFTALGDTLAALGFKYDSQEALNIFDNIMRVKLEAELNATIDMAKDRGAFPAFDATLEANWAEDKSTFFYFLKTEFPTQWEQMQKYGRRNISWSTIAPTGSLSLLAHLGGDFHGTTSGIEPLFKVYYIRRKKINPNDKNTRVDFIDNQGDKWQEFPVFHEGFKMWHNINFPEEKLEDLSKEEIDKLIKISPYYQSTAEEISWKKRVQLQAIAQKYITHSISSTINLPSTATTNEVSEIYFESWKQGLKGITIYRDGCRSGVLVSTPSSSTSTSEETSGVIYHDAPRRPKQLKGELFSVKVKGTSYAVIIGFLNNKMYEVFAFSTDEEDTTPINGTGSLIRTKKGSGCYDFVYDDENQQSIINIQNRGAHADEQMLTRLISGMMRHGVNPKFIIEQIDKCPLEIVSFGKAISRIIKKHIPEKELIERFKCKDCNGSNIRFEEGCSRCLDCGSSKCG